MRGRWKTGGESQTSPHIEREPHLAARPSRGAVVIQLSNALQVDKFIRFVCLVYLCVFFYSELGTISPSLIPTLNPLLARPCLSTVRECLHVCLRPLICHTEKKNKQTNGFLFFVWIKTSEKRERERERKQPSLIYTSILFFFFFFIFSLAVLLCYKGEIGILQILNDFNLKSNLPVGYFLSVMKKQKQMWGKSPFFSFFLK